MTYDKIIPENAAFVTFLTSSSYLAGVIILYESIKKFSDYPLIVAVVEGLTSESTITTLKNAGCLVRTVEPLMPRAGQKVTLIAERFKDVWCKLRVWEMTEYERLILLDADMMLRQNMDELFTLDLQPNWIAATHGCICNKPRSAWAPPDWTEEFCVYTYTAHPSAITNPPRSTGPDIHLRHHDLNAGIIILKPCKQTFAEIVNFLYTSPQIADFQFPEQDLLGVLFYDQWKSISWQYNAYKTMKTWHAPVWRDEEVKNIHFIVEKPWERYPIKGEESEEVEQLWWDQWNEWEKVTDPKLVQQVKLTMKVFTKA